MKRQHIAAMVIVSTVTLIVGIALGARRRTGSP